MTAISAMLNRERRECRQHEARLPRWQAAKHDRDGAGEGKDKAASTGAFVDPRGPQASRAPVESRRQQP